MKRSYSFSSSIFNIPSRLSLLLAALLLVLLTGCDSNSPLEETESSVEPPAPVEVSSPAPSITMSSLEVGLASGAPGLQFFAQSSADVFYKKVTIKPPPPFQETTYNLGNTFVISEESIALQNSNAAYLKVGGAWTFTYDVTVGTGQNARDHTVSVTYSIAGKNMSEAGPDAALVGTVAR